VTRARENSWTYYLPMSTSAQDSRVGITPATPSLCLLGPNAYKRLSRSISYQAVRYYSILSSRPHNDDFLSFLAVQDWSIPLSLGSSALALSCIFHPSSTSSTLCARKVTAVFFSHTRFTLAERQTGLDCAGRLFISDRAHLVFDFHQIVDGLKEVELGGSSCVFLAFCFFPSRVLA
jgi:hypothetical protein